MGLGEMIFFGAIALIVIGPKQLPEVARVVGRMLNEFKRATGDITSSFTGIKNEAQSFRNQAESYMYKQKAEFEQQMKEAVGIPEHEDIVPHDPTEEELERMKQDSESVANGQTPDQLDSSGNSSGNEDKS